MKLTTVLILSRVGSLTEIVKLGYAGNDLQHSTCNLPHCLITVPATKSELHYMSGHVAFYGYHLLIATYRIVQNDSILKQSLSRDVR